MSAVMVETPKDAARRLAAGAMRDGFKPTALHEYHNADGTPAYWRIRCKHPKGDKWIRPMRWNGHGYEIGEPQFPNGKPLYRLPELLAADHAEPVFIVEGEACADALAKLGLTATTSGGATSVDGADWSSLRGRKVTIWPDNDTPGAEYAADVIAKCDKCDVRLIAPDIVQGLPDGGDVVDWLAAHPASTADDIRALATVEPPIPQRIEPTPLPDPLPRVPAFDAALLPDAVRTWCEDAAEGLQVPLDFLAVPAMVALAGAIGRSIGLAMKRNDRWLERPLLWGCVIGRPSSGKSPALNPARRMLERLARVERDAYESALRDYEARALVAEAGKSNAKDAIKAALKRNDSTAARSAADSALFAEEPPSEPRIVTNDATVEKLGELLNQNPRGLVQFRDELAGWLASLDREGREGDRAFWLECWNGHGAFTVDRIGRGTVHIDACAMSLLGGMQPGKLAEYVRGVVRGGFADDGLIQRLQLAVYPDLPASWRYTDRAPDPHAEAHAWETFKRLRQLDPVAVGAESAPWADVPFIRFDDEAQALLIEWIEPHMQRLREGSEPPWIESHLAKYQSLVGRLALVLHLADGHNGAVSADTLAKALDWCAYLEGHARRIYAPATDGGLSGAHLILKRRAELGERFTARDLYRRGWSGLADPDAAQAAVDVLLEYGHLISIEVETGGRPTIAYGWTS